MESAVKNKCNYELYSSFVNDKGFTIFVDGKLINFRGFKE